MKSQYNSQFYKDQKSGSVSSAEAIVPFIIKLINPKSVVDVGCGIGTWLSVFKKNGVSEIVGLDGSWVNKGSLMIDEKRFIQADLKEPILLNKKFDLGVSLEVAEHLPKDCASQFVRSLVSLSNMVLFSAAIPFQGGTNHINEQWQEYWVKLFEAEGFTVIDCIRRRFWKDERVAFFYAQNMLLFVKKSLVSKDLVLKKEYALTNRSQLSIVHPQRYSDIGLQKEKISRIVPRFIKRILQK